MPKNDINWEKSSLGDEAPLKQKIRTTCRRQVSQGLQSFCTKFQIMASCITPELAAFVNFSILLLCKWKALGPRQIWVYVVITLWHTSRREFPGFSAAIFSCSDKVAGYVCWKEFLQCTALKPSPQPHPNKTGTTKYRLQPLLQKDSKTTKPVPLNSSTIHQSLQVKLQIKGFMCCGIAMLNSISQV